MRLGKYQHRATIHSPALSLKEKKEEKRTMARSANDYLGCSAPPKCATRSLTVDTNSAFAVSCRRYIVIATKMLDTDAKRRRRGFADYNCRNIKDIILNCLIISVITGKRRRSKRIKVQIRIYE